MRDILEQIRRLVAACAFFAVAACGAPVDPIDEPPVEPPTEEPGD